ncbi:TerD family protein [Crocosphaera watsonii WH 8501]|uniref:Stress protein n=6 Tax=Crocosphaera watsonii TaxID=263511 RepID=Q4C240_CROWT|nr:MULTISPECIES: TerD family protein [Crocosphaera]EAM50206.1 stress protein [Crocosphaera watsonii WH 8501]EHJ12093.1 tellurium resistance protein terE [Crocosphaera watsonii WH 0003]MCH2247308.1 TerD family protein [Crocosphaera sp.]NQZ61210.1 TerD family protein [Crocosphaera sp.]CCQ49328.1 Tellurium resistance protein TerD [Crocosphaera watsonii WH 8502]
MAINLKKGQRISLKKEAPGLTKVMCGLGWDVSESKGLFGLFKANDFDLDASVLCLTNKDKLKSKSDVVYYRNLEHSSGAITHQGDNLTGEGDGDDEQILVDLTRLPDDILKLVFVVNIYKARQRQQSFGQVKNAFVRLVNLNDNKEIARYSLLGEEYGGKTGMILAEVYRDQEEWKMEAVGKGFMVNGLQEITNQYY